MPKQRLQLINRAALPILDFKCSRWPYQTQIASEVDTLQRRMLAIAQRLPRQASKDDCAYFRRRASVASAAARAAGLWSRRWANRVLSWSDHLQRPRNSSSWAAKTLPHRNASWRQSLRASLGTSVFGGTLGTRSQSGKVHVRWDDGVLNARAV